MMYMHYCPICKRMFMLNGHHLICPKCHNSVAELKISYIDYVKMDIDERTIFNVNCENEYQLHTLSTTYRMHKYSKWYREKQESETLLLV
jgi:transcription elongation factor Elf1